MKTWNLDALFTGYETTAYQNTVNTVEHLIQEADAFANSLDKPGDEAARLTRYVELASTLRKNVLKAFAYVNLRLATDAQDDASLAQMNRMQALSSRTTNFSTKVSKWIPTIDNLSSLIDSHDTLKAHRFHFESINERAKHVLSDKEEAIIAKMSQTGSSAWGRLQGLLTSILKVDYEGKTITLPAVRNKAHSRDKDVRKKAYEAEIKAYEKVEHAVAAALNSIKGEVNEIASLRGFDTPLDEAVYNSRLKRETLDALIGAMQKHAPTLRTYLRRKATLLGHEKGLPWYDLFAPIGRSEREFSPKEATDYVVKNFQSFGDDLANLAQRAYDEDWIDWTPREGKRGGAFCSNLHPIKQSRILLNFDGSFSNVITLAHELGHAYHGDRIFSESILNASYTMPVAETASTLCETIVKKAALRDSKDEEALFILEQSLMGTTQVIIDILSRYSFEQNVFEARKASTMSPTQLKNMMIKAQKEAYGDALDPEVLHPYMWINKGHYYSGSLSYYNFPYAFGLLFAKGIYAAFEKRGQSFATDIDTLLRMTGQMKVEDVASLVGIDVSDPAFWDASFKVIEEEVDRFLALTE